MVDALVKEGNTKIHQHPESGILTEIIAMFALEPDRPYTWDEFATELKEDFPDLDVSGDYLSSWASRNVAAMRDTLPRKVMQNAMEAQTDLDHAKRHEELADEIRGEIARLKEQDDYDGEKVARLAEKESKLRQRAAEEYERWGVYPNQKIEVEQKSVNVDLEGNLEHLMGKPHRRARDAEGAVKD